MKSAHHLAIFVSTLILSGSFAGNAAAASSINFEGEVNSTNVSPGAPYQEGGLTFTPFNEEAATFDSTEVEMLGNTTDFLGFAGGNTMTIDSVAPFSLFSIDIGMLAFSADASSDFMITGFRSGLADLVSTTTGVTNMQTLVLNWVDLDSVTIVTSTDSGIDNLSVDAIPEPSSLCMLGFGSLALLGRRRRSC